MDITESTLIKAGVEAVDTAAGYLAEGTGVEFEEFPPSAALAAIMAAARYDGWDFDKAVEIARTQGPATCTEIAGAAV